MREGAETAVSGLQSCHSLKLFGLAQIDLSIVIKGHIYLLAACLPCQISLFGALTAHMIGSQAGQQKQAFAASHRHSSFTRQNVGSRISRRSQAASHAAQSAAAQQHKDGAPRRQDAAATAVQPSRRQLLRIIPAAAGIAAALLLTHSPSSSAAADAGLGALEKQLPGLPAPAPELPKTYQRTMHRLVNALRDTIETEAAGAKEFEVGGCVRSRGEERGQVSCYDAVQTQVFVRQMQPVHTLSPSPRLHCLVYTCVPPHRCVARLMEPRTL